MPSISFTPVLGIMAWCLFVLGAVFVVDTLLRSFTARSPKGDR